MRVAIRAASGKAVGFGHMRRCLTLAEALRAEGAAVRFVADDDFDEDVVIADDYALDAAWFAATRARAKLLVIDDLADRVIDADLVTNSALDADALPYRTTARRLFGPSFALVRPAFRDAAREPRDRVERVLVTLGGSDPQFRTRGVVAALLAALPAEIRIDAVMGPHHGDDAPLEELTRADARVTLHRAVDLPPLVAAADLAVSGGGQTTFELAAAGLPAVALAVADNQRHVLAGFERAGSLVRADDDGLAATVARVVGDAALRRRMSEAGRALVDGRGAHRVAAALLEYAAG